LPRPQKTLSPDGISSGNPAILITDGETGTWNTASIDSPDSRGSASARCIIMTK
jgi:hypothetical protein